MKKIFVLLFVMFSICLSAFGVGERTLPSEIGKVLSTSYVDSPDISQDETNTKQIVLVEVITGKFKGTQREVDNMLTGNPAYDISLKKGDKVILHLESPLDEIKSADDVDFFISDVKRDNVLWLACGIFCLFLVIIGKKKGLFSLVSIFATVGLIFCVLVPLILKGLYPVIATVIVGILSTVITIYLVGGRNAKSTAAIIGTVLSLILAGLLAMLTIYFAKLTGFAGEESIFLYTSNPSLNFKGILASSIIIAALGALMDTAVSIASTINEIHETDSSLSVKQLFRSGMNVGRDVIGTMSNTLILVYLGSSLPLVLLSNNIDLQKFFNLNQVATEISSAIIGSIAILACVPLTAIIASVLIKNKKQTVKFDFNKKI